MANLDAAFGLRPIGKGGGPYDGQTLECFIATASTTTDVFIGDVVKIGPASSTLGHPGVIIVTGAKDQAFGVVTSFRATPTNLELRHGTKGTERICQVVLADSTTFYEVQADGLMEAADVGLNSELVLGAGSTVTGASGYELDASAVTTSIGDMFQVMGFVDRPDNDLTLTNAKVIVRFNDKADRVGA